MTTVTDKVKLDDNRVGIVKFVGEINKKSGVFYGVEITKGTGLNSGNVAADTYFPCKRNKGVFIKEPKIARSKPDENVDPPMPRITYGTRLDVPDKGIGTVKYVGYPEFRRHEQLFYGIELEEPNGKNNGTVQGKFYFRTADGHGIFLPSQKIAQCQVLDEATEAVDEDAKDADDAPVQDDGAATEEPAATEEATEEAATEEPEAEAEAKEPADEPADDGDDSKDALVCEVGDGVLLDGDKRGLVRFVGENKETRKLGVGLWYGIRLVEQRGNCDGTYKGVKYFKCPPGYGAIVQAKRITRKLTEEEMDFDFSQDDEPTEAELARHAALEAAREKKKQIRAFRAKFKEIDTDNNMTIELDEFQRLMAESTGSSPEDAERLFYEIDVSRSGAISFAEFDGWFQKQKGGLSGGDDEKMDEATAAISQALADDIQEDVDEDVQQEIAAEDAAQAEAEAEAEAEAADDAPADEPEPEPQEDAENAEPEAEQEAGDDAPAEAGDEE